MNQPSFALPTFQAPQQQAMRAPASVWLNAGFVDSNGVFQSPFKGCPVDVADKPKFGGLENLEYFQTIQEIGNDLGDGEYVDIALTVRISRKKADMQAVPANKASIKSALLAKA